MFGQFSFVKTRRNTVCTIFCQHKWKVSDNSNYGIFSRFWILRDLALFVSSSFHSGNAYGTVFNDTYHRHC